MAQEIGIGWKIAAGLGLAGAASWLWKRHADAAALNVLPKPAPSPTPVSPDAPHPIDPLYPDAPAPRNLVMQWGDMSMVSLNAGDQLTVAYPPRSADGTWEVQVNGSTWLDLTSTPDANVFTAKRASGALPVLQSVMLAQAYTGLPLSSYTLTLMPGDV